MMSASGAGVAGPGAVEVDHPVRHRLPGRRELAVLLSLAMWPLGAALVTLVEGRRLPAHFGNTWSADGSFAGSPDPLPPWFGVGCLFLAAVAAFAVSLRVFWLTPDRTQRRITVFWAGTAAAGPSVPYLALVLGQARGWRLPPVPVVIVTGLVVGVAAGAVLVRLLPAAQPWPQRPSLSAQAPRVQLAGVERVTWTGRLDRPNWWFLLSAGLNVSVVLWILVSVADSVIWIQSLLADELLFVLAEAVVTALAIRLRVGVDARGVWVRCPVPWVRWSLPLARMVGARAVQVYAGVWSRGVIRTRADGRTGLYVRSGPALEVLLQDGTLFAVTVDGADEAAAVVNALVDRRDGATVPPT